MAQSPGNISFSVSVPICRVCGGMMLWQPVRCPSDRRPKGVYICPRCDRGRRDCEAAGMKGRPQGGE